VNRHSVQTSPVRSESETWEFRVALQLIPASPKTGSQVQPGVEVPQARRPASAVGTGAGPQEDGLRGVLGTATRPVAPLFIGTGPASPSILLPRKHPQGTKLLTVRQLDAGVISAHSSSVSRHGGGAEPPTSGGGGGERERERERERESASARTELASSPFSCSAPAAAVGSVALTQGGSPRQCPPHTPRCAALTSREPQPSACAATKAARSLRVRVREEARAGSACAWTLHACTGQQGADLTSLFTDQLRRRERRGHPDRAPPLVPHGNVSLACHLSFVTAV
jgi:hypothetical protein